MSTIPSPILIFGDLYSSKNAIIAAKKKYAELRWVTKSASTDSLDDIRMEAGLASFDDSEKILLIDDLPNKKQTRDFLIDLAGSCTETTKLIIWDSTNQIKVDPKTKTFDKIWGEFLDSFKTIKTHKIINNGETLNEKSSADSVEYVIERFSKFGKEIIIRDAKLLVSIVGYEKGMLDSEIKKLSLVAPAKITSDFILEHAFPTTKESVLYKVSNILDAGSYEDAVNLVDKFINSGINENVIGEIFVKKARWQLATAHFFASGLLWGEIPERLMGMGRFPSKIWWDDERNESDKKRDAEMYQSPEGMLTFMTRKAGLPSRYFKIKVEEKAKVKTTMTRKGSETLPMFFMASQTVDFVKNQVAANNKLPQEELKTKILTRGIKVYLFCQEKLFNIRTGSNPVQDLQEMARVLMNVRLEQF